jgi:hypothetical protein
MDHDCFFKRQITLKIYGDCLQAISFTQRKSIVARNERFDSGYEKNGMERTSGFKQLQFPALNSLTCFAR